MCVCACVALPLHFYMTLWRQAKEASAMIEGITPHMWTLLYPTIACRAMQNILGNQNYETVYARTPCFVIQGNVIMLLKLVITHTAP